MEDLWNVLWVRLTVFSHIDQSSVLWPYLSVRRVGSVIGLYAQEKRVFVYPEPSLVRSWIMCIVILMLYCVFKLSLDLPGLCFSQRAIYVITWFCNQFSLLLHCQNLMPASMVLHEETQEQVFSISLAHLPSVCQPLLHCESECDNLPSIPFAL